jgi:hypothetical protein
LIGDDAMMDLLTKRFGSKSGIAVIDPTMLGVAVDGHVSAPKTEIKRGLAGLTSEKVLIPVNCHGNHWCSIMMDLTKGEVFIYDSSSSSYITGLRALAQTMTDLLPERAQKGFRSRIYDSGLGIQTDNYNCGIYVLLAFEIFCGAEPLRLVDRRLLQCMRYRYLRMCM